MATAKKLPSGNWRVRVIESIDADGKKHMKSFTAPTKKEAEYMAAEFAIQRKEKTEPKASTLGVAFDDYINSKDSVLSPSTIRGYRQIRNCYFADIMDIKLSHLSKIDIQTSVNKIAHKVSPKTTRNAYCLLSAVLNDYAPDLPHNVKLPQKIKPSMYIPTEAEVQKIVEHVKDTSMEIPILLASCLGLRRSEIVGLKWDKVNLKSKVLTIDQAKVVGSDYKEHIKPPKSQAGYRELSIPDNLVARLIAHKTDSEYVTSLPGVMIQRNFKQILEELGIEHFRFHDLRHYNASVMLALGIPNKYAQARMGHSTDYMLKNVYQHLMAEKQDAVTNQMNTYLNTFLTSVDTKVDTKPKK